jgi:hypothetical protein
VDIGVTPLVSGTFWHFNLSLLLLLWRMKNHPQQGETLC